MRKNVFYVDWDDTKKDWKSDPVFESDDLNNAIDELRAWMKREKLWLQ